MKKDTSKKKAATKKAKATKTTEPKREDIIQQSHRDIEQAGLNIQAAKKRYEVDTRYERVAIGISLLQAKAQYHVANDGSRNPEGKNQYSKRSSATTAQDLDNSKSATYETPESFEHFLSSISWLPRRTAYAYIRAAENLGLTDKSTKDDIERLRKQKTLHELTGKDWSQLCGVMAKDKPEPKPETTTDPMELRSQAVFGFLKDSLHGIAQHTSTLKELRSELSPKRYATTAAFLQKQLEEITGQSWEPAEEEIPNNWKKLWPDADLESFDL